MLLIIDNSLHIFKDFGIFRKIPRKKVKKFLDKIQIWEVD